MKTLLAILATVFLLSCDGAECGDVKAGADECWPGPGKCWFAGSSMEGFSMGVYCNDQCGCGYAETTVSGILIDPDTTYGCVAGAEITTQYSCNEYCVCDYPADDSGTIIDLPQ